MEKDKAIGKISFLTSDQCREILNDFWCYYMQNGFGNKSKTEIDTKIYDILCKFKIVDDLRPAMLIGRELETNETNIKKYKRDRFYKHMIDDADLKEQIKQIMISSNTNITNDKIVLTINNSSAKWYLETILKDANVNYDYSFNTNNISMKLNVFMFVFGFIGGDLNKLLESIEKNREVQHSPNNEKIKTIIQNIKATNVNISFSANFDFSLFNSLINLLPNITGDIWEKACKLFF